MPSLIRCTEQVVIVAVKGGVNEYISKLTISYADGKLLTVCMVLFVLLSYPQSLKYVGVHLRSLESKILYIHQNLSF